MTTLSTLKNHRLEILKLSKHHKAANIRVFGSSALESETNNSDIDLLVDWEDGASLVDWVALKEELETLLERDVDLVSSGSLHWYVRDRILSDAIPLP